MIYVHIAIVFLMLLSVLYILFSDNNLYNVVALEVLSLLAIVEFLLLNAPDVAIAEAAVGAVLASLIFLVAIYLTKKRGENL